MNNDFANDLHRRDCIMELFDAIMQGNTAKVSKFVKEDPSLASSRFKIDKYSITPMHAASFTGNIAIAKLLLASGIPIDIRDDTGKTPLHYSSQFGHLEMVAFLLDMGSDIDAKDNEGMVPAANATSNCHEGVYWLEIYAGSFKHQGKKLAQGITYMDIVNTGSIRNKCNQGLELTKDDIRSAFFSVINKAPSSPSRITNGGYEYKDFIENLDNVTLKDCYAPGDSRVIQIVEDAVKRLLNRVSSAGWEPCEPIDARSLWIAGHVEHTIRERDSFLRAFTSASSAIQDITLLHLKITCRRRN